MVQESWFRSLWKPQRKSGSGSEKVVIGVLAFEVASLMSKIAHMWWSLGDKQVARLREEVTNSVGVKKLVSENEEYIADLISAEFMDTMEHVANSVARIAKKCSDLHLKHFDAAFDELLKFHIDPYGWTFNSKKMDSKVKRMQRFVSVNAQLYHEMEILAELEHSLKRLKANNAGPEKLLEFQKKVAWKQNELKNLRATSLWDRTYDYTVVLLARSLFTVFSRIKYVFGITPADFSGYLRPVDPSLVTRSRSVSGFLRSSVHPSETGFPRFSSGPIRNMNVNKIKHEFLSGPLSGSSQKPKPIPEKTKNSKFYSGFLGMFTAKSNQATRADKTSKKTRENLDSSPVLDGAGQCSKTKGTDIDVRNLKGSAKGAAAKSLRKDIISGVLEDTSSGNILPQNCTISAGNRPTRPKMLTAPRDTLGAACLALHYANVIIVIERLAVSPHLIGDEARDDLYSMLPATVRAALRHRLKPFDRAVDAAPEYDPELVQEWTDAIASILDWLAPLAHNMIRWQSERSYEHQSFVSRTSTVLAQTLYFAKQERTEAAIVELLVGLNYLCRSTRELTPKAQ